MTLYFVIFAGLNLRELLTLVKLNLVFAERAEKKLRPRMFTLVWPHFHQRNSKYLYFHLIQANLVSKFDPSTLIKNT